MATADQLDLKQYQAARSRDEDVADGRETEHVIEFLAIENVRVVN